MRTPKPDRYNYGFAIIGPLFLLATAACTASSQPSTEETLDQFAARIERYPPPSLAAVEPIEKILSGVPCIGDLARWERQYAFSLSRRGVDETVIDFELKEAGRANVQPGLKRTFPGAFIDADDTPTKMAFGQYDRRTGRVTLDFCGENLG